MDTTTKKTLYAELAESLVMEDKEIGKAAGDLRDALQTDEVLELIASMNGPELDGLAPWQRIVYIAREFYAHGAVMALYCYNGIIKDTLATE